MDKRVAQFVFKGELTPYFITPSGNVYRFKNDKLKKQPLVKVIKDI